MPLNFDGNGKTFWEDNLVIKAARRIVYLFA